jgi:protein Mpv17
LISCPPNILWQEYLEYKFPGETLAPSSATDTIYEKHLDIPNTLRKFLFDQTLGAFVNTMAFVAAMAAFKGRGAQYVQREVEKDVIPLMINSWKVWPFVALMNFTFVPVNRRVIVGAIVGLFWGIYLSMFAAVD